MLKIQTPYRVAAITLFILALGFVSGGKAYAATPPDACFDFDSGTGTIEDYYNYEDNDNLNPACTKDVDIPATIDSVAVTAIGNNSFSGKQLTSVSIPNSVLTIGNSAFHTSQLASLVIGSSVTSIDDLAFYNSGLSSVTIPNSVITIGTSAFEFNNISSLTFGNSVTTIEHGAFKSNDLTSVIIPDSVISIGGDSFLWNNISSLDLGSSLSTIGEEAFACNKIVSVDLPDSLTDLGDIAFILQSSEGKFCETALSSPATANSVFTTVWYVQLYTNNPSIYSNETFTEGILDNDINSDGDKTDSLGGHIINPARVTLSYKNIRGATLAESEFFTGSNLTTYLAKDNAANDMGLYYRIGSSHSFTPQSITGYTTPLATTVSFANADNQYTFVYSTTELAKTGLNILVYELAAITILTTSLGFLLSHKLKS